MASIVHGRDCRLDLLNICQCYQPYPFQVVSQLYSPTAVVCSLILEQFKLTIVNTAGYYHYHYNTLCISHSACTCSQLLYRYTNVPVCSYFISIFVTGFGRICIVHTSHLEIHKIYRDWYTDLKLFEIIKEQWIQNPRKFLMSHKS